MQLPEIRSKVKKLKRVVGITNSIEVKPTLSPTELEDKDEAACGGVSSLMPAVSLWRFKVAPSILRHRVFMARKR